MRLQDTKCAIKKLSKDYYQGEKNKASTENLTTTFISKLKQCSEWILHHILSFLPGLDLGPVLLLEEMSIPYSVLARAKGILLP